MFDLIGAVCCIIKQIAEQTRSAQYTEQHLFDSEEDVEWRVMKKLDCGHELTEEEKSIYEGLVKKQQENINKRLEEYAAKYSQ